MMTMMLPQKTFQCSQWVSSSEHLAINKHNLTPNDYRKKNNTMCDVAYGETQRIIKTVLFIVILEVVKSWQGKGQRNSS